MEIPSGRRSFMVSSDLAAETVSPVKSKDHHPSFDAENIVSAMELKRIPHGITSKHENRKSLSPKRSNNVTAPRMPLTCSRADVVNLPNAVPPPVFSLDKSSKRASSDFETSDAKRLRNDDSLFDEDFMAEEAFSPIRLGVKESTMTMQTPSRPTESVAVSPPSDQHSRIIDETMSEASNKDSPLKNVSTIATKEFEEEKEIEANELDEILNSRANMSVEDALRMSQEEDEEEEEPEKTPKINYERLPSPNELWESIKDVEDIESDNQTIIGESMISKAAVDKMTGDYLEQIGQLEEASTKTSRELHEAYAQIQNLTAEVESLEKQKHELRDKSSGLAVEIGVLEGKIAALETKYRAENRSNTSKGKKIETYKVRYQQIFSAYKETHEVYNHTLERLDQAEHDRAELRSKVNELEAENASLNQKLTEATVVQQELTESKAIVETELVDSKEQIAQINSEISDLKSQLEQSKTEFSAKELELAQQLDLNEKLKEEISSRTSSFENEHELYQKQEAELSAYKAELDACKNELKDHESALNEKISSLRVLEEQVTELKTQIQEKEQESAQKEVELQEQLTSQISALEHDKHALERNIEQLQTDVKAHLADIQELEISNSELRKSLDQATDDKKSAEEISESLSLEIKNLKGVLSEQAASITSLNATIQGLEKQVSEHEAELESSLEALAQDLYVQYSEKHEKKVEILRKGYESKWTSRLNKSEKEREALQEVVDSLTKQLATEKAEKASLMKLYEACIEQR